MIFSIAFAASTGSDQVSTWLRGDFVVIVMIISGSYVLMRAISFVAKQQVELLRIERGDTGDLTAASIGANRAALYGAVRWGLNFCIIAVATTSVLLRLQLPSSALVILGSIAGAGLGFGAQQVVGDIIAGIYIISERQFGVGDIIRVGPLMQVGWIEGRVEEVTLRVTKLRTFDGDVVNIANGELRRNVNMSRDWSRVLISVPLPRNSDIEAAITRIDVVCEQIGLDPKIAPLLLEVPHVTGIDDLGAENVEVRVSGRSLPVQQWKVERELRRRIARELRDIYIVVPGLDGGDVI